MAPPITQIPLSALEAEVNLLPNGRRRKPQVNLRDCPLKELVQYKCNGFPAKRPGEKDWIICDPVVRLFRQYVTSYGRSGGLARLPLEKRVRYTNVFGRCENGLSVETTAWESWKDKQEGGKETG